MTTLRQFTDDADKANAALAGMRQGLLGLVNPLRSAVLGWLGAVVGVVALTNALGGLITAHGAVRDGMQRLIGVVEQFIEPLSAEIGRGLVRFAEWLEGWIARNQEGIAAFWDAFLGEADAAGERAGGIWGAVRARGLVAVRILLSAWRGLWNILQTGAALIQGDLTGAAEQFRQAMDAWGDPVRRVVDWLHEALDTTLAWFGLTPPAWLRGLLPQRRDGAGEGGINAVPPGYFGDEGGGGGRGFLGGGGYPGGWGGILARELINLLADLLPDISVTPELITPPIRRRTSGAGAAGATGMVNNYFLDASQSQREAWTLGAMQNPRVWSRVNGAA